MRNKKTNRILRFLKQIAPVKLSNGKFQSATLFFLLAIFAVKFYAAGINDVDPNFNVQVQTNSFSTKSVWAMLTLPDDKILVSGNFNSFNNQPVGKLIRLTANGLLDTTFNNNLLATDSIPNKLYMQPDGKILIVGSSLKTNNSSAPVAPIIRLNADGTIDSTFNFFGGINDAVSYVAAGTDGKILISGIFSVTKNGVVASKSLVRLNPDGTLDESFNYSGTISNPLIELQNNKPLITVIDNALSQEVILRLNTDGSVDLSFTRILSNHFSLGVIKATSDNKILVLNDQNLRRFNENGSADSGFQVNTGSTLPNIYVSSDNRITYGVRSMTSSDTEIRRILANGTADPSFNNYAFTGFGFSTFTVQSDGQIFIGDIIVGATGTSIVNRYVHLFGNGTADTAFNPGGIGFQTVNPGSIGAIAVQSDQKIIIAGKFDVINNVNRSKIARLNADNTVDGSFQINTNAAGNYFSRIAEIYTLSLQPDGKIIVTGDFSYVVNGVGKNNLVRLNADGSIDSAFIVGVPISDYYAATGGGKNRNVLQSDGKILIATSRGESSRDSTLIPTRLNPDGSKDTTFNPFSYSSIGVSTYDIAIQPDRKILISGVNLANGDPVSFIIRLNTDGSLDQSFQKNEEPNKVIGALKLLADGKILIIKGGFPYYHSSSPVTVSRLNADGSPDATFASGAGANGYVNATVLLPSGQLLIGGKFTTFNGQPRQNLALLNADGSLDSTTYNVNQEVSSLAVDGSGRVLVGGSFTVINVNNGQNYARSYVARLTAGSSPQAVRTRLDFDNDGRADLATFTASTGIWSILTSQNNQTVNTQFGQTGDKYAPADYDNDGKTDIAVFRPANGIWYLLQSSAGFAAVQWGAAEDKPVAGDYDGDGKAEIAVWRPSNGVWYILRGGTYTFYQFGKAGDIPVPADFDGDGKTDIAVFRPSNGTFYWTASGSNNLFRAVQFGQDGDVPAVADYNGDGKADLVVWRPSSGVWYQYLSTATDNLTFSAVQFGQNGDEPIAADYDGDGKADFAVRRQSNWYFLKSGQGFSAAAFGAATSQAAAAMQN